MSFSVDIFIKLYAVIVTLLIGVPSLYSSNLTSSYFFVLAFK